MENYKAACSRQTAACKSCAPMYVVFDGAYIKACSDLMGKGIAAAHQLKPGVCGGKWNSDPDEDRSFYPALQEPDNLSQIMESDGAAPKNTKEFGITNVFLFCY